MKIKDNTDGFVGVQKFTRSELKRAFDELENIVYNDRTVDYYEYYLHTFIDGLGSLNIDFDFNALADVLSKAKTEINTAFIDVWHIAPIGYEPDEEGKDGHHILIYNGEIAKIV